MKLGDIFPIKQLTGNFRIVDGELPIATVLPAVQASASPDGSELYLRFGSSNNQITAQVDASRGNPRSATDIIEHIQTFPEASLYRIGSVSDGLRRFAMEQLEYSGSKYFPSTDSLQITLTEAALDDINLSLSEMPLAIRLIEEEFFLSGFGEEIGMGLQQRIQIPTGNSPIEVSKPLGARIAFVGLSSVRGQSQLMDSNNFRLFSKRHFCDIEVRPGGVKLAVRIGKRHRHQDASSVVHLARGSLSFTDGYAAAERSRSASPVADVPQPFLARWELYGRLEEAWIRDQAIESGSIQYNKVEIIRAQEGIQYDFKLAHPLSTSTSLYEYIKQGMEMEVAEEGFVNNTGEPHSNQDLDIHLPIDTIPVGVTIPFTPVYGSITHVRCILSEEYLSSRELPKKGYLIRAMRGDVKRLKRRQNALERVRQGRTQLNTRLAQLLDTGDAPVSYNVRQQPAITEVLENTLQGRELTWSQKEALELTLNTPDIALVQGPPGTGKTTVIRALIARLMERGISKAGARIAPRILVTSYQHDAVDNAIEGLDAGGLPTNRIGGKRGMSQNDRDYVLYEWVKERQAWCTAKISGLHEPTARSLARELNRRLAEAIRRPSKNSFLASLSSDGRSQSSIRALLIDAAERAAFAFPEELAAQVSAWITRPVPQYARNDSLGQDNEQATDDVYLVGIRQRWNHLLAEQRTDPEVFADDGNLQAGRLLRFWQINGAEIGLSDAIPAILEQAADHPLHQDEATFIQWKLTVKELNESSASGRPTLTTTTSNDAQPRGRSSRPEYLSESDQEAVQLLRRIIDVLMSHDRRGEGIIADVLGAYAEEIQDLDQVRRMTEQYGEVVAGTCQQTAEFAGDDGYDFVIIDEAARATPLDLLIPMWQGRRIILVGDHRQLPHILEDEVQSRVVADTEGGREAAAFLATSLFERLFRSFEQAAEGGAPRRTVTLKQDFRMHPVISRFVSDYFYDGVVQAGCRAAEREHTLNLYGNKPVSWIDIGRHHGVEQSGRSKTRLAEVKDVIQRASDVLLRDSQLTVGIITFYERQAMLLQQEADQVILPSHRERLRIGTVDAFQGRQFDVVFLSTVRSNALRPKASQEGMRSRVGFLALENRLCVAFSRARRLLVVCGDADTVAGSPDQEAVPALRRFLTLCQSQEGYYEQV